MFARTNFVQNSLTSTRHSSNIKTDEELLAELKADKNAKLTDISEEFGDDWYWVLFGRIVDWCRQLSYQNGRFEPYFTSFIVATIALAGVLVGLDTYENLSNLPELTALEIFVITIFACEIIIKVLAEGKKPWEFFTGPEGLWNSFDFVVVIFSMPYFSSLVGSNSPAIRIVSRVFRLFRVAKIVHQIPALQVIVKGLVGGVKSIIYVVTLLVLIFYLYAVFGVFMFKENDPFFFRDVPTALLTLFRVCTLENWGENMYINAFGCREFDGGVYLYKGDISATEWAALPSYYRCADPMPQSVLSVIYFITFIIVSSLVMLSLFIGVITMSMQESLNDMRREVEEANRKKKLLRAEEEMEKLAVKNTAMLITQKMGTLWSSRKTTDGTNSPNSPSSAPSNDTGSASNSESSTDSDEGEPLSIKIMAKKMKKKVSHLKKYVSFGRSQKALTAKEKKAMRDMAEMKALLMQAWSGTKQAAEYHNDMDIAQEGTLDKYIRHAGIYSRDIVENQHFTNFITIIIVITAVLVGVETDYRSDNNAGAFDVIENVVFAVFAAEVILRFLAEDCHFKEYFRSSWNTFDFLVVALSKVPGGGLVIVLLRLVRLLRVLKLVKSLPQLSVIVNALLMGISSIGYISVIMFLTFYLFAILGVLMFSGNDSLNFGQLHLALVALFKISTLDNWGEALYINFYGCDKYPPYFIVQDEMFRCNYPLAQPGFTVVYFTCFVLVGSLVMITLFVGVVTTSMEEATRMQYVELELETRIMDLCHERSVTPSQLEIYRRVFSMLDLDGGGTIEGEELRSGLAAVNIECTPDQLEIWVKEVDANSDGVIDLIEFIIFMTNMKKKAVEEQEKKAMRRGADAFLRMRKKAQARKAAQGSNGEKVAPTTEKDGTKNASTDPARKESVAVQRRSARRNSIQLFTGGLFGGNDNANEGNDKKEPSMSDASDSSPLSAASLIGSLSRGISSVGLTSSAGETKNEGGSSSPAVPGFLSRAKSRFFSTNDTDSFVQDASTFGTATEESMTTENDTDGTSGSNQALLPKKSIPKGLPPKGSPPKDNGPPPKAVEMMNKGQGLAKKELFVDIETEEFVNSLEDIGSSSPLNKP